MSKAPAFQFYPSDFLTDENVVLMSLSERGAYITLICYCWKEGSIPNDLKLLARLCGGNASEMQEIWDGIKNCFIPSENDPNRLVHPRLIAEENKQKEYSAKQRENAKKRWGQAKAENNDSMPEQCDGIANRHQDGNALHLQSSSSPSGIEKERSATGVTKAQPKGTRLSPEWRPSEELLQWSRQERPDINPLNEIGYFHDYWKSISGKDGVRLDWDATWRNWIRRSRNNNSGLSNKPRGSQISASSIVPASERKGGSGKIT